MRILIPDVDLPFILGSLVQQGEGKKGHLHAASGEDIFDSDFRHFASSEEHVHGNKKSIAELLDAMANAALFQDWKHFDDLLSQLLTLRVSAKTINEFGQMLVRTTIVRGSTLDELGALLVALEEQGFNPAYIDEGQMEGYRELNSRTAKSRRN